jgi:uncharacterized RDD family membrane protein YckC
MSDYGTPPPPPPGGGSYGAAPPPDGGFAPAGQQGALASWPQRVGGYIIDQLILLPGYIIYFIGAPKTFSASSNVNGDVSSTNGASSGNLAIMFVGIIIILAIAVWNRWIKGGQGQSIGKKVVGLKLVGAESGQPIGTGMAFARDLAHILDSIVCGLPIGWLWPLWDSKKQTWGDKVVKTLVVTAPK